MSGCASPRPPRPPRFTFDVEVGPDPLARRGDRGRGPELRLRLALKAMLRMHGLRCLRVAPQPPPGPAAA